MAVNMMLQVKEKGLQLDEAGAVLDRVFIISNIECCQESSTHMFVTVSSR